MTEDKMEIDEHNLSPPLILRILAWRKEKLGKDRKLVETNPGVSRRVRLLLSD
jgi:hypothetical protein